MPQAGWQLRIASCQMQAVQIYVCCKALHSLLQKSKAKDKVALADIVCRSTPDQSTFCFLDVASDSEYVAVLTLVPCADLAGGGGAGQQAAGATAYVTLEPCNHYGKTPPCSQALVDAKVAKVSLHTCTPSCSSELCSTRLN